MDVEAPKNNNYTLWSSDDIDYARMFATDHERSDGTIYKVLVDKKLNLLDTPTPKAGEVYDWLNLPFSYKNNGIIEQHPGYLMESGVFKDKNSSINRNESYRFRKHPEDSKLLLLVRGLGDTSKSLNPREDLQELFGYVPDTDNFINTVSLEGKFQGVRFNKVYDGNVKIGDEYQYYPINEVVLFKNTPRILIPENKSKWSLLFKNIDGYKQGGPIYIKEKNKGKFTESAKRAGKSVQEHARDVVNNPKATKLQKKRALFALNSKRWSKK